MYEDKYLICKECGREFVFSAAEQEFYAEKGFQNEPGRCLACRQARKERVNRDRDARPQFTVTCASCGRETTVPFEPTAGKPVYCRDCFQERRRGSYSRY